MNPSDLLRLFLWLAALGALVLVGARLIGGTARKAASNLPG